MPALVSPKKRAVNPPYFPPAVNFHAKRVKFTHPTSNSLPPITISAPCPRAPRSFLRVLRRMMEGDANADGRSFALAPDNVDFAVQHSGAFPHPQQSERPRARTLASGQAAAVVLHFEDKFIALLPQVNVHLSCLGVPDDVGQRLLKNAEHGRGAIGIKVQMPRTGLELAPDACPFFKFPNLPFDGGFQPQFIEHRRAQVGGDLSDHADGFVHRYRPRFWFLL